MFENSDRSIALNPAGGRRWGQLRLCSALGETPSLAAAIDTGSPAAGAGAGADGIRGTAAPICLRDRRLGGGGPVGTRPN